MATELFKAILGKIEAEPEKVHRKKNVEYVCSKILLLGYFDVYTRNLQIFGCKLGWIDLMTEAEA